MTKDEIIKFLQPITVVKVLDIQKHPNADKLLLVKVDFGLMTDDLRKRTEEEITEDENHHAVKTVITGAPNLVVGDIVPYLGLGEVIPGYLFLHNEKITLEKRILRGMLSTGMVLAEDEIGLSEDHTGIYKLNNQIANPNIKNEDGYLGMSVVDFLSEEELQKIFDNQKKDSEPKVEEVIS